MNKKILKICFYHLLLRLRAYRVYKFGKSALNWNKRIINGEILVSMDYPKGQFYIDLRSHFINASISGEYERNLMQMVERYKISDGLIINIGANIGFYAIHLANSFPNHKVIALEPNPDAYTLLLKNIEQNNLANRIQAINVCISDKIGSIPFSIVRANLNIHQ